MSSPRGGGGVGHRGGGILTFSTKNYQNPHPQKEMVCFFSTTVRPLLSGHPWDSEKWQLNRGTMYINWIGMAVNMILLTLPVYSKMLLKKEHI